MGHITYADGIAIYELIFYSPCLIASFFVTGRHGLMKSSGWIFLTIFCAVRIVGASARIATIPNPNATSAYTTSLVCSVLGLSPLLMASLGLITRAYYSMLKQPWSTILSLVLGRVVHIPAVIALILCIVGATSAPSPEQIDSQSAVHAGIILYGVVLVMLIILTLGACLIKRRTAKGEGLLIVAVLCAIPFIFVRLLYSLLSAFSHAKAFNSVTGSETVALFMSVLQEMVVVMIYIATGLKLENVPTDVSTSPGRKLAYRAGRGDFGAGKLGVISLVAGILEALSKSPQDAEKEDTSQKDEHRRRDIV